MRFITFIRSIVWPAVIAFILAVAAVVISIFIPGSLAVVLGLGSAAVTLAILSNRA